MRCIISTVPKEFVRASQVGDWDYGPDTIISSVSLEITDPDAQLAIGIHELVEAYLCRRHGITDADVVKFDLQYEQERKEGKHDELAEPGDAEDAPYRQEHMAATHVERAVCAALGLDWEKHSELITG